MLFSGGWDNVVKVWDLKLKQLGVLAYHSSNVLSLQISPCGQYISF